MMASERALERVVFEVALNLQKNKKKRKEKQCTQGNQQERNNKGRCGAWLAHRGLGP